MKPRHVILAALAATSLYALAAETIEKLPEPWYITGANAKSYQGGIDLRETTSGKGAKFLRYAGKDAESKSFGALGQTISAQRYLGQRVRFQARIKTRDVSMWAGLWLRIDGKNDRSVAFYNSYDKPIKGSTDWQLRSVTLDVPPDAATINFGVNDVGTGQVWIDELSMEVVGQDVAVDAMPKPALPDTPSL